MDILDGSGFWVIGTGEAPPPPPPPPPDDGDAAYLVTGTFRSRYAAAARPPNPWDEIARWLARLEASGRGWETRRRRAELDADDAEVIRLARLSRKRRRRS